MKAFYSDNLVNFLNTDKDTIIGQLSSAYSEARFYKLISVQIEVWKEEISVLKKSFKYLQNEIDINHWHILFEYPIPRRGKRIDVVILTETIILVLEFKVGATNYQVCDKMQVEDYCLDLRDFHAESFNRIIIPVLLATEAPNVSLEKKSIKDNVKSVHLCNRTNLASTIEKVYACFNDLQLTIDGKCWEKSNYKPTPTIIEAAQTLYAGQNVKEISRSHAGAENLTKTSEVIFEAIKQAQQNNEKLICFITGVPGSGKTLAGLNIVHNKKLHEGDLGVFLSGNGPLVKVLSEALARDDTQRNGNKIGKSRHKVSTFIHNVHKFLDEYFYDKEKVPVDKVVVFDEAQRAWDRQQSYRKFKRDFSEPVL